MLNDTDIGGLAKFLASSGKDAFPRVPNTTTFLSLVRRSVVGELRRSLVVVEAEKSIASFIPSRGHRPPLKS